MSILRGAENDRFLTPGTPVRLAILVNEADEVTPELGRVVHCWREPGGGRHLCLVAFFGCELPEGEPEEEPRIIRHFSASLAVLEGEHA